MGACPPSLRLWRTRENSQKARFDLVFASICPVHVPYRPVFASQTPRFRDYVMEWRGWDWRFPAKFGTPFARAVFLTARDAKGAKGRGEERKCRMQSVLREPQGPEHGRRAECRTNGRRQVGRETVQSSRFKVSSDGTAAVRRVSPRPKWRGLAVALGNAVSRRDASTALGMTTRGRGCSFCVLISAFYVDGSLQPAVEACRLKSENRDEYCIPRIP